MSQPPARRVMTCAPNEVVARGIAAMVAGSAAVTGLGWAVPREDAPQADFVRRVLALAPEVVVVAGVGADSRWLRELVGALVRARPAARVLAVVWTARPGWLADLALAGASGVADLDVTAEQLRSGIQAVAAGHDWVSPGVAEVLGRQQRELDAGLGQEPLSQREAQVLGELVKGADNVTIGAALGISEHTVAGHVRAICAKLKATSRLDAAVTAIRTGLVEL